MDLLTHGTNAFRHRNTAMATALRDTMNPGDASVRMGSLAEHLIQTVMFQQGPDVIWGTGSTLEVPEHLAETGMAKLMLPNNTSLTSSAQLTTAALNELLGLSDDLAEARREHEVEVGQVIETTGRGPFQGIIHAVCRQPGDSTLRGLADILAQCGAGTVIPVWGAKEDLPLWAAALEAATSLAEDVQANVRLPLHLRFRPEDADRGEELEKLLIEARILVEREEDEHAWRWGGSASDAVEIPESVLALVGVDREVHPLRFARWAARGVRLAEEVWTRHVRVWQRGVDG